MPITEQVPYWENILNAKANLSHITASAKGHEYQPCLEEVTRGNPPPISFPTSPLLSTLQHPIAVIFPLCYPSSFIPN